jgi:site-specific recombinase XerC
MKKDLIRVTNPAAITLRRPPHRRPVRRPRRAARELEWLANLTNPTRARVIAWRKDLEKRKLAHSSMRRKFSALSALFDYLCEHNAVADNPVDGVKRPMTNGNEASTPALGDAQARGLLETPPADTVKGVRDRAILVTLLYHVLRREELCALRVRDIQSLQSVMHFRIKGKRDKFRFVSVHATALRLIDEYLMLAGRRDHAAGPLFRPFIPGRQHRRVPIDYDRKLYALRPRIEMFFDRIKENRHLDVRYEKTDICSLGFITCAILKAFHLC